MRILELVVRFSGLVRVFPSVRFAISQFKFFVRILEIRSGERRILEMSSISTNLRDGSSLVESVEAGVHCHPKLRGGAVLFASFVTCN